MLKNKFQMRKRKIKQLNKKYIIANHIKLKLNSVALVRKRTIPTERPPHVGEVSANFCGKRVSRGQRNGSPRPLIANHIQINTGTKVF
jgi:hypothetical protein